IHHQPFPSPSLVPSPRKHCRLLQTQTKPTPRLPSRKKSTLPLVVGRRRGAQQEEEGGRRGLAEISNRMFLLGRPVFSSSSSPSRQARSGGEKQRSCGGGGNYSGHPARN
ncbi:unnamed protein product, partial [Linum tenue]